MESRMENRAEAPRRWTDSTPVKLAVLGFVVLMLLIPVAMVTSLIRERSLRKMEAAGEVAGTWGGAQAITGPLLAIPYREIIHPTEKDIKAAAKAGEPRPEPVIVPGTAYFLPQTVSWRGKVEPEIRKRGIFETVVYQTRLKVEGTFTAPDLAAVGITPKDRVLWNQTRLAVGVSEVRGLQERAVLSWGGHTIPFLPGTTENQILPAGFNAPIDLAGGDLAALLSGVPVPFRFELVLRGSGDLQFFPAGEETQVELASTWPSPSFGGAFLPAARQVSPQGFTASWKVPFLARGVPQQWAGQQIEQGQLAAGLFGVNLFLPADSYHKTERSVKYAVLFIVLTCLTFFLIELVSPVRLHAVHYLLVGCGLALFYLLLLALSEHLGFGRAYLLAAAACSGLITAYARAILASTRWATALFALLAGLYGYLYGLLRAEDTSLLMGSVGLFVVLALVMFLTRRLDWRRLEFRREAKPESA